MNNLGKMLDTQEITNDDIERAAKFQLFARAVQPPTRKESMLEYRFVLRIAQFIFALASLLSLMLASLRFNYSSSSIAMSGFELTCTTSVFSLVFSVSCTFVYCFPMKLEIPPHRHKRLSPNEVVIDLGFVCLWLLSSSSILWYGRCYELTSINAAKIVEPCIPWNICAACGYIASLMHLVTVVMGVIDIVKHEKRFDPNARTIAKGSWEKWHDD